MQVILANIIGKAEWFGKILISLPEPINIYIFIGVLTKGNTHLTLLDQKSEHSAENELIQLLLKRQSELNSLLEITNAINKNAPASVLFEMLELIMRVHMKVGKMRLLVKDGNQFGCTSRYGGDNESSTTLQQICKLLNSLKTITNLATSHNELLREYNYFVPVHHKSAMLAFVLIGDFETSPELLSNDLNFMQTMINVIVVALENKKLFKDRIQRERLQREVELASEVQNMMFPSSLPNNDQVKMEALYMPHQNIGGDYFDYIKLNDDEFLWCIADVSGKGISAALLMANLQASLRAWASVDTNLAVIIKQLNKVIIENTNGERFITMFLARYNLKTRQLHFLNAGHNPPILVMGNKIQFLKSGTTVIGAFDELPFINPGNLVLQEDALIFNYTDGLVENSTENVFIDDDELAAFVVNHRKLAAGKLNKSVLNSIQNKHEVRMNTDDVTLLTIKIS
nr:PP2C family protein-serine/threonine phosphatase [Hufsiella arboris]